jgi:hypothetical protein
MAKTKKTSKKTLKTRKYRKGGGLTPKETTEKQFHIFFIDGLDCNKKTVDYSHFLDEKTGNIHPNNFTYICESHTETIRTKIKNYSTVGKTSCAFKPLNSDENKRMLQGIIDQILEMATKADKICVYGWSFGGMIVNRVVEMLIKSYSEDIRLKNIYFTTVGSIYITKKDIGSINLINYISIGDVANTCTRGIKHKQYVDETKLEKYKEIPLDGLNKIYYKKREGTPIIYDVCFVNGTTKSCSQRINRIQILRAKTEWNIHFNYWDLLYNLMRSRTNNIEIIVDNIDIIGDKIEEDSDDESVSETLDDVLQYKSVSAPGDFNLSNIYPATKKSI